MRKHMTVKTWNRWLAD